jgi:IS605 OrfB family transposase
MKLTAKVKLVTNQIPYAALQETMARANAACNWISNLAWANKTFQAFAIQKFAYHPVKKEFGLAAQVVIRCISKVADAYKLDKKTKRTFRPTGAISFDDRILKWHIDKQLVNIWTTSGRLKIPFVSGASQLALLRSRQGESDLLFQNGNFYLAATCNVEEPDPSDVTDFLGVDLGIANIASDSDGKQYSGSQVKSVRHRQRRLRSKLQRKQTRAAKRRLKKLSGRERNFASHTNHCISKQIVAEAKRSGRGIAIEDLGGILERVKAGRKQRAVLHSWAFAQLRAFLEYKAALAGVPLFTVDPRNTSRECSACGHTDKRNRPNQSTFRCRACGHAEHADTNAARVISGRPPCKRGERVHNLRLSGLCVSAHSAS